MLGVYITQKLPRIMAITVTGFLVMMMMGVSARAAEPVVISGSDFYIPRPVEASDDYGVPRLLVVVDVPVEHQGQPCLVSAEADNGDSVHAENFGFILTEGDRADFIGTESEPNVKKVVVQGNPFTPGETVSLYNVMLPDPDGTVGTSVDYFIILDCEAQVTTTTTQATTTTTQGTTTTTAATTTTTGDTTTTTQGTTTTTGESTTTTEGETTTTPPNGSTLPDTGPTGIVGLVGSAVALMIIGVGFLIGARAYRS